MRGLFLYSSGMEDNEALSTMALLRRAKIEVDSASTEKEKTVITSYKQVITADFLLADIDLSKYDFQLIPGGPYVARIIDQDVIIKETIKKFYDAKKLIGAICAAPRFLGRLGILDNLEFTAFPGSEKDAPKGKYLGNQKSVTTDQIITARSAGAVIEFVYALITKIKDEAAAKQLLENIIY